MAATVRPVRNAAIRSAESATPTTRRTTVRSARPVAKFSPIVRSRAWESVRCELIWHGESFLAAEPARRRDVEIDVDLLDLGIGVVAVRAELAANSRTVL